MLTTAAFAQTAALVGDPTRANMLAALMDDRALTAKELADAAGVTAPTASGHLAQLAAAGLLAMERQGRHRYHRLASPAVAHMLETIMSVAAAREERTGLVRTDPRDAALRRARTCYDHLAGQVAVAIADRMTERGQIELSPDGGAITEDGKSFLRGLGVNLSAASFGSARHSRGRLFCRPCLDWSERRFHIAGALGAALCTACLTQGWMRRIGGTRAVAVTPMGRNVLDQAFGLRDALD